MQLRFPRDFEQKRSCTNVEGMQQAAATQHWLLRHSDLPYMSFGRLSMNGAQNEQLLSQGDTVFGIGGLHCSASFSQTTRTRPITTNEAHTPALRYCKPNQLPSAHQLNTAAGSSGSTPCHTLSQLCVQHAGIFNLQHIHPHTHTSYISVIHQQIRCRAQCTPQVCVVRAPNHHCCIQLSHISSPAPRHDSATHQFVPSTTSQPCSIFPPQMYNCP